MTRKPEIEHMDSQIELKIAVLGKTWVGKSAWTHRFWTDRFEQDHNTTIEDQYCVPIKIEENECKLHILDTAGQDDYHSMLDTWINSVDGFIWVYSINDKDSYEQWKNKYERIVKLKGRKEFSVIIVGNKCDLIDLREVNRDEAEQYWSAIGVDFLEASALKKINVREIFWAISLKLLNKKYSMKDEEGEVVRKKTCYCF